MLAARPRWCLKIAQFNANSLRGHFELIRSNFINSGHHIISITETWLHSYVCDNLVKLDNYLLVRNDREGTEGGGVACYIHHSLSVKILATSPGQYSTSPEYLLLEISGVNVDKLLFATIDRPPRASMLTDFTRDLLIFSHAYENIILTGDLNYNLLINDYNSRYLRDHVNSLALHIVPSGPTHHTMNCDTWLDVFIVDDLEKLQEFTKSDTPFIAGHDLLEMTYIFEVNVPNERRVTRRSYRNFVHADYIDTLTQALNNSQLSELETRDINDVTDELVNVLNASLNIHAPYRTFCPNRPPAPWLSRELRNCISRRNALYMAAKRSGNILDLVVFREFRDSLKRDLILAKNTYYLERISALSGSNKIWIELSALGLARPSLPSPLNFFPPNELITYYSSISNQHPLLSYDEYRATIATIQTGPHPFNFTEITPEQVRTTILSSPSSSCYAAGSDGISLFILNESLQVLCPFLAAVFNLSLNTSTCSCSWRKALLRPLSKIKLPLSPSDTRPIAIVCEICKALERSIHEQITSWAASNHIFDPRQSGFRSGYSTQFALLRLIDEVNHNIDKRLLTIVILFDFSKAFDTIPHLRLLCKLKRLGFADAVLDWVFSYLTDRTQAVKDDSGNVSSWLPTTSGVPQGSVLGPLLFTLFVNDIGSVLRHSQHIVYADDTQIYMSCQPSELDQAIEQISIDVNAIAKYAIDNGLRLNIAKSKILILGSNAFVRQIDYTNLPPISVDGTQLPYVNEARNLGVTLMKDLSWKSHVSYISQKVHLTLHKLKYHRNALSRDVRAALISSLIFPILDYCCLVYNGLTNELDLKLQRLINCCVRFVYDLRRDVHISPYRHELGWLSVRSRRAYFLGITMFKVLNYEVPSYIQELFQRAAPTNDRASRRQASPFQIPIHRTASFHNSFSISGVYLWNSLPAPVKSSPDIKIFKSRLFSHLMSLETVSE